MTSIPRLMKYANLDHVTPQERLIFLERKPWWKNKLVWYPVIAALLALLVMVKPSFGSTTIWGTAHGKAFVDTRFSSGPLLRFTVTFGERG